MGNVGAHVWTIICSLLIFLLALLIWFMIFMNLQNTLASDNLQDAVRTSMYLASDNSARTERGAFVINKDKFNSYLSKTHIQQFSGRTLGNNAFTTYYLPDNAANDQDSFSHFSGNDHGISHGYNRRYVNTGDPNMKSWNTTDNDTKNGKGYEAIRGLCVAVDPGHFKNIKNTYTFKNGNTQKGTSDSDYKKYDTFTATDVIQTFGKDSNFDTTNDLTR